MEQSSKLIFPKIRKVRLERFSLFSLEPNINLDIHDGVFCLAGANGLGKSTFLAAVNYGITGIVAEPGREFRSVEEYYRYCLGYSNDYFSGRISEQDREAAAVTIHLQVSNYLYKVTRGIFEPDELRELTIADCSNSNNIVVDGSQMTGSQRNKEYETHITARIGLRSFQQFVFLQHFVFTFDESRRLLLWDQAVLNQSLFLGIGADYEMAEEADKLRRQVQRADSLVRNIAWQASKISQQIELLREVMQGSEADVDPEDVRIQHEKLTKVLMQIEKSIEAKRLQLEDVQLKWAEASSELTTLQAQYTEEFSKYIHKRSHVELHPIVVSSTSEGKCALCGNEGSKIIESIKQKIENNTCPLCGSSLSKEDIDQEILGELKRIDKRITELKEAISTTINTADRVKEELHSTESEDEVATRELKEFESNNERILAQLTVGASNLDNAIKAKLEELRGYLQQKKAKQDERNQKHRELMKLQHQLQQRYASAEEEFVPLFRELAVLFIGVPLDMRMNYSTSIASPGLSLVLEMQGSMRRQTYQLSESQRFFLDIALRMALTQHMSHPEGKACLLIDTPEGSLDIAYESRAGQMFASFVNTGHDLITTANINTSQLLQKMASECGRSRMTLQRMTTWTTLSEVQLAEEELFRMAYDQIEAKLESKEALSHG